MVTSINRVEVIDHTGRAYVFWGEEGKVAVSLVRQDDGRTLKIFMNGEPTRGYLGANKTEQPTITLSAADYEALMTAIQSPKETGEKLKDLMRGGRVEDGSR